MGRIYEALKRSDEEQAYYRSPSSKDLYSSLLDDFPGDDIDTKPIATDKEVSTDLQLRMPDLLVKSIMFTGTSPKCGTSRTAVSFATSLAKDSNSNILLIDVNLKSPSLHEVFNLDNSLGGMSELLNKKFDIEKQIRRVEPINISVLPCYRKQTSLGNLFGSSRFENFLKEIREQFDHIILDGPPVSGFSESLLIGSKVDGVIMVIVSGNTRRHVALRAKSEIEKSGGRLLGVVLNRRKYYIPGWLYNRI